MAETDAMDVDQAAQLRILILLDITGSMGLEIRAVREATAELVRLSGEKFRDTALAISIITFTESDYGSREDPDRIDSRSSPEISDDEMRSPRSQVCHSVQCRMEQCLSINSHVYLSYWPATHAHCKKPYRPKMQSELAVQPLGIYRQLVSGRVAQYARTAAHCSSLPYGYHMLPTYANVVACAYGS